MSIRLSRIKNSPWYSVAVVILGAWLGVLLTWFLAILGQMAIMVTGGPAAAITLLPVLAVQSTLGLLIALFLMPMWAVLGGWLIARFNTGKWGFARRIGITYFSETHPISVRTNELARELGLPKIRWIGWFDEKAINAFAMGINKRRSIIAFSRGAIEGLTKEEFDAVIAHELGHVASNDMTTMSFLQGVQSSLTWFLWFRGAKRAALLLFLPLSQLEILRLSRKREFWADGVAGVLVGKEHMISTLEKVKASSRPSRKTRHIKTLRFQSRWSGLFSTHPSIDSRIRALQNGRITKKLSSAKIAPIWGTDKGVRRPRASFSV